MTDTRTSSPNGSHTTGSKYQQSTAAEARDMASDAMEKGEKYVEQAQDLAVEKLGELETAIRRNPIQAAAIAAGIGFVFALIARR